MTSTRIFRDTERVAYFSIRSNNIPMKEWLQRRPKPMTREQVMWICSYVISEFAECLTTVVQDENHQKTDDEIRKEVQQLILECADKSEKPKKITNFFDFFNKNGRFPNSTEIIAEQVDAMVDAVVYTYDGVTKFCGINAGPVFDIVMDSNMDKADENGNFIKASDGKILKSPRWRPPDAQILKEIERQQKYGGWQNFKDLD